MCSRLDVTKHSTDFQFGRLITSKLTSGTCLDIKFDGEYGSPSEVVRLSAIEIDSSQNVRIKASGLDITMTDFKLYIYTWMRTGVNDATMYWISSCPPIVRT